MAALLLPPQAEMNPMMAAIQPNRANCLRDCVLERMQTLHASLNKSKQTTAKTALPFLWIRVRYGMIVRHRHDHKVVQQRDQHQ